MKTVNMKVGYKESGHPTWVETIEIPDEIDHRTHCATIIIKFNSNLRLNEKERKLISVDVMNENSVNRFCEYEKQNLVTRSDMTDLLKCKHCGSTYIRRGLYTPTTTICKRFIEKNHFDISNIMDELLEIRKDFKKSTWEDFEAKAYAEDIIKLGNKLMQMEDV